MSLVGSLEDLGLGDILQIVSLARKSGLLSLRSDLGQGRIVFEAGLVRAAYVKSAPETLSGLLAAAGFAEPEPIDRIVAECIENGSGRDQRDAKLAEVTGLSPERLHSLCRENLEQAVFEMFRWRVGEFSFDVCDELETRFGELVLPVGINAQYLTMEATRLCDEGVERVSNDGDAFKLSGEEDVADAPELPDPDATGPVDAQQLVAVAAAVAAGSPDLELDAHAAPDLCAAQDSCVPAESSSASDAADSAVNAAALAAADPLIAPDPCDAIESEAPPEQDAEPAAAVHEELDESSRLAPAEAIPPAAVPLVVIDSELLALEWLKARLAPLFTRIHIFQHAEGGVARIRQYLGRGVIPVVLVSSQLPADSLTGAREAGELVRRMRAQAPRMPILAMFDDNEEARPQGLDAADAVLVRPSLRLLADDRRRAETERMADELRRALAPWSMLGDDPSAGATAAPSESR